jgi:mono/diheme cytochrome c family protein
MGMGDDRLVLRAAVLAVITLTGFVAALAEARMSRDVLSTRTRIVATGFGPRGSDGAAMNAQRASPPAGGDATRGRAAFDGICGRCHPHGNADVGPRLIGLNWPEARVREQVRHGRRTMRPISPARLPDDRLDDVIAYLRTIHTVR